MQEKGSRNVMHDVEKWRKLAMNARASRQFHPSVCHHVTEFFAAQVISRPPSATSSPAVFNAQYMTRKARTASHAAGPRTSRWRIASTSAIG
jgi:hypothetical protein